jgi:hypothetical protein
MEYLGLQAVGARGPRRRNKFFDSYRSGDSYDREAITHVMGCCSLFPASCWRLLSRDCAYFLAAMAERQSRLFVQWHEWGAPPDTRQVLQMGLRLAMWLDGFPGGLSRRSGARHARSVNVLAAATLRGTL